MTKINEAEYERLHQLVYSVVFESLTQKGVSMVDLKAFSRKFISDLKDYDSYHVGRWVSLAVTAMIRQHIARLGVSGTGDTLVFATGKKAV